MSEFKSGDEVLHTSCGREGFKFIAGPDSAGFSCVKNDAGVLKIVAHNHLKTKPKTITVEMPKPQMVAQSYRQALAIHFNSQSDCDAACEAIASAIDPKGVE